METNSVEAILLNVASDGINAITPFLPNMACKIGDIQLALITEYEGGRSSIQRGSLSTMIGTQPVTSDPETSALSLDTKIVTQTETGLAALNYLGVSDTGDHKAAQLYGLDCYGNPIVVYITYPKYVQEGSRPLLSVNIVLYDNLLEFARSVGDVHAASLPYILLNNFTEATEERLAELRKLARSSHLQLSRICDLVYRRPRSDVPSRKELSGKEPAKL